MRNICRKRDNVADHHFQKLTGFEPQSVTDRGDKRLNCAYTLFTAVTCLPSNCAELFLSQRQHNRGSSSVYVGRCWSPDIGASNRTYIADIIKIAKLT